MRSIGWNELVYSNDVRALVNLTSLMMLFDTDTFERVSKRDLLQASAFERRARAKGIKDPSTIRRIVLQGCASAIEANTSALKLLERIVVCDALVFDERALEGERHNFDNVGKNIENSSGDWLRGCQVPPEVYEAACESISKSSEKLRGRGWEEVAGRILPTESADYWWSMGEKLYHDELATQTGLGRFAFASSNDSFRRLLFYLEIARAAECPVVLSLGKEDHIETLGKEYQVILDAHAGVVRATEAFRDKLRDGLYTDTELPIPALSEHIVLTALDGKTSLLEAALQVRESEDAKAYRSWLRERRRELRVG